jgi:cyclophilin family peptidyl-prolyl cis-trans isomerase/HEAT repeat protein
MRRVLLCALSATVASAAAAGAQDLASGLRPVADDWIRIARIEDSRARTTQEEEALLAALRSGSPLIRAHAARAIGRLERATPTVTAALTTLVTGDADPMVRAVAAHAVAQSVKNSPESAVPIVQLWGAYRDRPADRYFLAEAVGRLPQRAEMSAEIVRELTPLLSGSEREQLSALRGMFFISRQQNRRAAFDTTAVGAIRRLAREASGQRRSLALTLLSGTGHVDAQSVQAALSDTAAHVRRDAVAAVGVMTDTAAARTVLTRALRDSGPLVRYEALRVYARRFAAAGGCDAARAGVRDASTHVKLLAIDLLGTSCRAAASGAELDSIARTLPAAEEGQWHASAHALVALARVDTARARVRLEPFLAHTSPFVRTYAARAAGVLGDERALARAARDAHANVRTAAVEELRRVAGHRADSIYIAQLRRTDVELLIAAAAALEGSTYPGAEAALLTALENVTAQGRETSRDARIALLERLAVVGSAASIPRVTRLLGDFDPAVAAKAAEVLAKWSPGQPAPVAAPRPVALAPFPTFDELARLESSRFEIEMWDGQRIELQLFPFHAPTNAARFARLAERNYFDGLTLHRVVPNFVVQGGSPGANEYHGDGPFTRDEVGWPNWRGTVGLSTRGRDTGDAQIYINQIDNVRLDYDYTIFGVVTRGMDVVDALQEGARIRDIRTVRPTR